MKETGSALLKKSRSVVASRSAQHSRVGTTVKCGSVTIKVVRPSLSVVKRNVLAGQMALSRAKEAFLTPGVSIHVGKDVPLFSVDPANPAIVVRTLNGNEERGVLKNGVFEVSR